MEKYRDWIVVVVFVIIAGLMVWAILSAQNDLRTPVVGHDPGTSQRVGN